MSKLSLLKIEKNEKRLVFFIISLILLSFLLTYTVLQRSNSTLVTNKSVISPSAVTVLHSTESATQLNRSRVYSIVFFVFLIGLLCIFLVLSYGWIILHLTVPLDQLKLSAHQLGLDINYPIEKNYGPNIIKEIVQALTEMQEKLQTLVESRTQLLAAISHDLRTPITRAKLKLHFLEHEPYASGISNDLQDMESMINATLSFAKNDFLTEKKKNIDIIELLAMVCDDYVDANKKVHLECHIKNSKYFAAKYAIKRCFNNIIDNAIKYAGEVWVSVTKEPDRLIFEFKDNGPGIPKNKLQQVLKPFYRIRDPNNKFCGAGLGLTIVKEIVQQHNGKLTLTNLNQGLMVRIEFFFSN